MIDQEQANRIAKQKEWSIAIAEVQEAHDREMETLREAYEYVTRGCTHPDTEGNTTRAITVCLICGDVLVIPAVTVLARGP